MTCRINAGLVVCAMGLSVLGCAGPELPGGSALAEATPAKFASVLPAVSSSGVNPAARFTFELPPAASAQNLKLFQGTLSEYHERRVVTGELPNTLLEREVKISVWPDTALGGAVDAGAPSKVSAVAESLLAPSATYTWALVGQGSLLSFQVMPEAPPLLQRYWPLAGAAFWGYAVYCAEEFLDYTLGYSQFEPGFPVELRAGVGLGSLEEQRCVHFDVSDQAWPALLVPPAQIAGLVVEPSPLRSGGPAPVAPIACQDGWHVLGPGCIQVMDDRMLLQPPSGTSLWQFSLAAASIQKRVLDGEVFVVRGMSPGQRQELEYRVFLSNGETHHGRAELVTAPPQLHLVINEVLANPLGSEPEQEWVELYNDGGIPVDLQGFTLADSGGEVALPPTVVLPAEYVLLVPGAHVEGGDDVPFAPGATVVRLPSLGANGLSNSGEAIRLISSAGRTVSQFAARAATTGGVSIARVTPDAPDGAASSFALHAAPGASPGAANTPLADEGN